MNHYQKICEREKELRKNVAKLVKFFRAGVDDTMTQTDFAKVIGISTNALRRVEQGTPDISLAKLASVLVKSYEEYSEFYPSGKAYYKRVMNTVYEVLRNV